MLLPLQLNNLLETPAVDVDVQANTAALTLTTYPATVTVDIDVAVNTAALTLTTNAATVTTDVDVQANTANLSLATYAATVAATDGVTPATTTAGRSKRRYYSVEVEGEIFVFTTVADVEAFLATVRREAEEQADRLVTTPVVPKPPKIRVKTAKGKASTSKTVQEAVKRTQKAVTRAYVRAAKRREVDAEISRLITAKLEREAVDEDNIIALLL